MNVTEKEARALNELKTCEILMSQSFFFFCPEENNLGYFSTRETGSFRTKKQSTNCF